MKSVNLHNYLFYAKISEYVNLHDFNDSSPIIEMLRFDDNFLDSLDQMIGLYE